MDNLAQFIWLNGRFVLSSECNISLLTHSFHYTGSVFEGERAYNGKIFKLREHSERLLRSALSINLKIKYSVDEIINASEELIIKNNLYNAYVRPIVWRSTSSLRISDKVQNTVADVAILALRFSNEDSITSPTPMKLCVSKWKKIHCDSIPIQSKTSAGYIMSVPEQELALSNGYDDCLFLDLNNYVAECSVSNVFFAKSNEIVTPTVRNCLNGITRQVIIKIAKKLGFVVRELDLTLDQLVDYDTCFVTGSSVEVKAVACIDTLSKVGKLLFPNNITTDSVISEYKKIVRE
ncbi:aminotransferase class IV [Rickettsia endosymbiont of Cardiosporidium cionae]|uniref:aminotransferase class IV n=1 Tax=Rickettsia endosymbiont of Cardiosporidium cionae TaxID=2777155 RepID=UPI001895ED5A|nr:aminotransferase class IV [Rickettsia endosymbiont of Cardiosporidium cionae]KAF8818968.1 branched-chain amino acid transaminase [Rickettsia endosymbiont of Cardiosporidium cionae]